MLLSTLIKLINIKFCIHGSYQENIDKNYY